MAPEPEHPSPPHPTVVPFPPPVEADVWQRLYERRTVSLRGPLEGAAADLLCAQLMALDAEGDGDVTLHVNSSGGTFDGAFAVYDVMGLMRAAVHTVCVGVAASAGAFVLATGTGVRAATPSARIGLQRPTAEVGGRAADVAAQARQVGGLRDRMDAVLAGRTGRTVERIAADADRGRWLSAPEAAAYGLIDEVRGRALP